jgi:hypothetical protein
MDGLTFLRKLMRETPTAAVRMFPARWEGVSNLDSAASACESALPKCGPGLVPGE